MVTGISNRINITIKEAITSKITITITTDMDIALRRTKGILQIMNFITITINLSSNKEQVLQHLYFNFL